MKISACYITKNEEMNIGLSIKSIQGVYDELVVLDTGSSDGTKEQAATLGATVYDYIWQDDFAAARNEALKLVTGDWLLFLDADEIYQGKESLRSLLEAAATSSAGYEAIIFDRWNVDGRWQRVDEKPTRVVRAFRRALHLYYEGRIHERLINDRAELRYYEAPAEYWFSHTGYSEDKIDGKFARNLYCLQKDIEKRGLQEEHYFYLGITYFGLQEYEKARVFAKKAINSSVHYADSDAWPWHILIESQRQCGLEAERQLQTVEEAVRRFPQQAEFYGEQGIILSSLGRVAEAAQTLWKSLQLYVSPERKKIKWGYFTDESLAVIYCRLAQVEEWQGKLAVAELAYRISKRLSPQRQTTETCYRVFVQHCRTLVEQAGLTAFFAEAQLSKDYGYWLELWQRAKRKSGTQLELWQLVCLSLDNEQKLLPHEKKTLPQEAQFLWDILQQMTGGESSEAEKNIEVSERSPLVSIMIPTYNMPEFFRRTMRSAALQTYPHLEIIVCDNSTNEDTARIMDDYREDSRVRYIRNTEAKNKEENFSPFKELARGEYLQWLMHDDILCPTKIAQMAADLCHNNQVTLVASQRQIIDANGMIKDSNLKTNIIGADMEKIVLSGEDVGRKMLTSFTNFIGEPSAVLFRRKDLVHNYWLADCRGYKTISDVAMWLELMEKGNLVLYRDELSYYRRHPGQEGQATDVVLLSRLEWLALNAEYYQRKVFLHTRKDYEAGLRALVWEYDNRACSVYEWQAEASPEMWNRYENTIHKAKMLLRMKR